MGYPGEPSLDPKVQQRILTAFAEAVRLYREGHNEEARTVLRSIADVDPQFAPAHRLEQAVAAGAPVDLAQLIGEVTAHPGINVDLTMAKAREAMAQRDLPGALTLVQSVLRELPGQTEARQLVVEVQTRLRAAGDVEAHLARARQALDAGLAEEARGFLRLAQNADPEHPEIAPLERRLQLAAKPLAVEAEPEFEFEVFEHPAPAHPPVVVPPPPPIAAPPFPSPGVPRPVAPSAQPAPSPVPANVPVAPPVAKVSVTPPAPVAPIAAPEGITFDQAAGTPAMDFRPTPGHPAVGDEPSPPEDSAARVQALLDQGQQEFDRGDFHSAIDTWSRIYLIDARHPEAERRIEQARLRKDEVERQAEHRFYEAREAFDQGRWDDARALCQQVLELQPQHLEAHDLLLRLETPAAPPPPPGPALADEDDLFRDDFVPARISSSGTAPATAETAEHDALEGVAARARGLAGRRPFAGLPLAWLGVAATVLVVAVAGGFLLRGKVFSGGGAVAEALTESEKLAGEGRLQEAIQLLQSLQGQAEGEQANRVNQRMLEYQRKLKAKTAPPKTVDSKEARDALAAGQHLKALALVREGLSKVPGDLEMNRLQADVTAYSQLLPPLADAITARNWESVRQLAGDLLKQHPEDREARRLWSVGSFNSAVILLRKYQVAQAHELLGELAKDGGDQEVVHLQQFAKSYLARPADPRYQIFVTNVELRAVE